MCRDFVRDSISRRFCRGEIGVCNGRKGEMFGIIYAMKNEGQMTQDEFDGLRSQNVTSKIDVKEAA